MPDRLLRAFTGELLNTTNHLDKLLAGAGAVLAIGMVLLVSREAGSGPAQGLALASMGASAVLLFAVPHGALSQPWAVFGGHLSAALIGVTCAQHISNPLLAAALAVALAIVAMHYLRCIHPPGGATALFAVLGGPKVAALGYGFLVHPVLSNVLTILAVAVLFNYPFRWRRYPATLHVRERDAGPDPDTVAEIGLDNADLEHAMREMNLYVDMTEEDLARLYLLAKRHHATTAGMRPEQIGAGRCYSNGRVGAEWSVRKVIEESGPAAEDHIVYRVVGGDAASRHANCTRAEFARWARYSVNADSHACETMLNRLQAANGEEPWPRRASS